MKDNWLSVGGGVKEKGEVLKNHYSDSCKVGINLTLSFKCNA